MSDADPFAAIAAYYDTLVARYGHDPRACDYGRAESQRVKFRVLSEVMPLAGLRLLDVGCGFADYADYLEGEVDYTGIDVTAAMIDEARRLHPGLALARGNILDGIDATFDVVSANGIFYLLGAEAPRLMRDIVAAMWEAATRAVAFNSLSAWAPDPEPGEFHADPAEVLGFCRTLTPRVALRHDYHRRDFTVYLYR